MTIEIVSVSSAGVLLLAYGLYWLVKVVFNELSSPIRQLRGPRASSLIWGNLQQLASQVSTKNYSELICIWTAMVP